MTLICPHIHLILDLSLNFMAKKTNVDRKSSPNKKEDPKRVISNANIPNNVSENP